MLHLDEPNLCTGFHIVGGHPDLLLCCNVLLIEVVLTAINECQQIRFAIILGDVYLL